MSRIIAECTKDEDIKSTFRVMVQLRDNLKEEEYLSQIKYMQSGYGYHLYALFDDNKCLGALGFTYDFRLFCGKVMYIADLVTDENHRSNGVGKDLIDFAKKEAENNQCNTVLLDSGVQRAKAHKFYFSKNFHVAGFNFIYKG